MAPEVAREEHDFYPTPPEVTRALLASPEGGAIRGAGVVWEPACGDGAMARELGKAGILVACSDLIDRGCAGAETKDFYEYSEPPRGCGAIVTNPPYCEINARDGKARWLWHCHRLGVPYVALFLNADWAAAKGLAPVLDEHPISRVYVCRWKVDFTGKGAPPQRNSWFIWDAEHEGETVMRFLDREPAQERLL